MNIHEYQAKELFRRYQIPIPDGGVAFGRRGGRRKAQRQEAHRQDENSGRREAANEPGQVMHRS